MELKLVSFKLAKKLKKVGFKEKVYKAYSSKGFMESASYDMDTVLGSCDKLSNTCMDESVLAPTLELAKMWFREKHNIIIEANISCDGEWYNDAFWNPIMNKEYIPELDNNDEVIFNWYKSYEEALENGLLEACKLIK